MVDLKKLPKNIVRAEMKRRGLKSENVVELLKQYDEDMTVENFNNKVSRGRFSATFFLKCLYAIGVKSIRLDDE